MESRYFYKKNMKRKSTVTIGIPAYNEEANIGKLIKSLLSQKQESFVLEKIIVVSDGSTDKTEGMVLAIRNPKIHLIKNSQRLGQPKTQNLIVKESQSDILVFINADVLPKGDNFLEEIIKPFNKDKKVGIVGANTMSAKPRTFFEKVIVTGREFKKSIYMQITVGTTVYLCHGRGRAFSKELYKKIQWPDDCAEDAYSYFFCITNGFKFKFSENSTVIFRSPSNLSGHKKQSDRFVEGKKNLERHFNKNLINSQYHIPLSIFFKQLSRNIVKNPVELPIYFMIVFYLKVIRKISNSVDRSGNYSLWQVTVSSKKI